jgi:glycosyltransferase involved in cell wall biosynthesis
MPRPGASTYADTTTSAGGAVLARPRGRRAPALPAPKQAVGSIVIPAHNEARVIGTGLRELLTSLGAGVEVVVVCNGCTDGTAEAAREAGDGVEVVELAVASKVEALRAGDLVATAFPRAYIDADVLVSGETVGAVFRRLADGGALAARPPLTYDTSSSSWIVRRFYRARSEIPAVMGSLWGAGMYALSAAGRARFAAFPAVVADDLFVDGLFTPDEVELVDTDPVVVVAPATVAGLLASFRRVFRGNRAMARHTATDGPGTADTLRDLVRLARRGPAELVDAAVYGSVVLAARALAWRHRWSSDHWERDESSRR